MLILLPPSGLPPLPRRCRHESALRHALPYLEHAAPLFRYQSVGDEFWPNREELDAIILEVQDALGRLRSAPDAIIDVTPY